MPERKGPFCGAARRNGAGDCKRDAGAGTSHKGFGNCSWHGGSSPSGSRSADGKRLEAEAQKLLYRHDAPPAANPLEALQALAGRALAMEGALGELVNRLTSIRYEGKGEGGAEQLRAEVAVLERAMDRAGKLLVDIARLNIDERLVKIEEGKARIIVEAIEIALAAAGVRGQAATEAKRAAARHLRSVA
jgi:hypothetical protein